CHRTGHRQPARHPHRRRADGQPGPGQCRTHHRGLQGFQPRRGHHAYRHPRPGTHHQPYPSGPARRKWSCHGLHRACRTQDSTKGSGMKTWFRQHRYALGVTLRRLAAQPFSSLTNILVISLALAIPLLGAAVLVSVQPVVSGMSTGPEITVFMKPGAPAASAGAIAKRIQSEFDEDILNATVVSRDQALSRLRNNPAWADALAVLPENPLPDAVVVTLAGTEFASRATRLAGVWNTWKDVDHVQLDSEWVQRLQAILRFANIGLLLIAAG